MVPIFIVSSRSYTGKTFFALGLAMKLIERGYKVGYIKPLSKAPVKIGMEVFAADAVLIKEALSLPDPLNIISPFVLSFETRKALYEGKLTGVKEQILKALDAQKDKDFVLIGGAGDLFEGSALDISALTLIKEMKARALMVEAWKPDLSTDNLLGCCKLIGENFMGGIINKVPASSLSYVTETVKPFLESKGATIFGVFHKDGLLGAISVKELTEVLNGKVLCCEDRLNDFVEHFSIGAMDVDSALTYFRKTPNKAVITGAHRSDIQLAAMETATKCIILTGGLYTNEVVLGKAQSKGIPIISVNDDTFTVVDKIEAIMGKTRIVEKSKINRAKELFDSGFDMEKFIDSLKKAPGKRQQI